MSDDTPSDDTPSPFSPEVVDAIRRHMNDDHAEDNVVICRGLGGEPLATEATMTGMTPDGIVFDAVVEGESLPVIVPWSEPIVERAQVRAEVVRMHAEASERLGLAPREH